MEIEYEPFSLPLASPLRTASGRIEHREGLIVGIRDGDVRGVGEATPLPGWTESIEACREAIESIGSPPKAIDGGRLADRPAARHAVVLALADIEARRRGRPLYRQLGADGPVHDVPVQRTIGHGPVAEAVDEARAAISTGFDTIKLKVGLESPERDRERVAAVRRAIGDDRSIRLDANGAWDRLTAERALALLAPYDIEFVEQPVAADDLESLADLRESIDIAVDEPFAGRPIDDAVDVLEAADVAICKPMVLGGPDRARQLARLAADRGVEVIVTTTIDALVARTAAVHLAASLAPERTHGLATADLLGVDLGPDPAPIADGRIAVPQTDGLGTAGPWEEHDG